MHFYREKWEMAIAYKNGNINVKQGGSKKRVRGELGLLCFRDQSKQERVSMGYWWSEEATMELSCSWELQIERVGSPSLASPWLWDK